jgi:hypothetical protein
MFMTTTYKGIKNGVIGYYCGFKPEDATILETMDILNAEDGFELVRKSDSENVGNSVWLHDGDVQENYEEVEAQEPQPEPEE